MKKKISTYLQNHGINIFILLILFLLFLFISHILCQNQIENSLNNVPAIKEIDYKDFLANYYQVQSDWLNRWLTFLGIMFAISGIAVPLLLNASYKEKIKELQDEAKKYKESSIEQEKKINKSIDSFNKDYNKKISEFKKEMKEAIEQAEIDSILIKIDSLREEKERLNAKNKKEEYIEKINTIIKLAEKSLNKYKNESFTHELCYILQNEYYHRGLYHKYTKKDYIIAISDFEQCSHYNKACMLEDSYTHLLLLLQCYIRTEEYQKANIILSKMQKVYKEDIEESLEKKQIINILEENSNNKDAKNLLIELQKKIVD